MIRSLFILFCTNKRSSNHTHSGIRKEATCKKEGNSAFGFELADVVFGDAEVGGDVLLRYAVEELAGARTE